MKGQRRIERAADALDRAQQMAETFEGIKLGLQRHENRIGRDQRVDGQNAEGRRAVDENVVPAVPLLLQSALQPGVPAFGGHQLDLRARQVDGGRHDRHVRHRRLDDAVLQGGRTQQGLIDGWAATSPIQTDTGRGVALRIQIDDQNPLATGRKGGGEIDRGGGLADPALLIGNRENAWPGVRRSHGEVLDIL